MELVTNEEFEVRKHMQLLRQICRYMKAGQNVPERLLHQYEDQSQKLIKMGLL